MDEDKLGSEEGLYKICIVCGDEIPVFENGRSMLFCCLHHAKLWNYNIPYGKLDEGVKPEEDFDVIKQKLYRSK